MTTLKIADPEEDLWMTEELKHAAKKTIIEYLDVVMPNASWGVNARMDYISESGLTLLNALSHLEDELREMCSR